MLPLDYYNKQIAVQSDRLLAAQKMVSTFSWLRILLGLGLLVLLFFLVRDGREWQWYVALAGAAGFLALMKQHGKYKERETGLQMHLKLLEAELKALDDDHSPFLDGKEFISSAHPYSLDLDIFGRGSVYQLLCRVSTKDGEAALADLLERPYATPEVVTERQQSVQELATKPEFMHEFRVSGLRYEEGPKDREKILDWIHRADQFINRKFLFVLAVLMPLLSIVFGYLSFQQGDFHPGLIYVVVANWIILMIYSRPVKETHILVGRSVKLIDKYAQLLATISNGDFRTDKMKEISQRAATSVKLIMELRKLAHLFDSRANGMVGPLVNSFFLFDIYCVLRLELWRKKNRNMLDEAFRDVSLVDTYISLANYAFNNPDNTYPEVATTAKGIEAKDLKHPLLSRKSSVGNDVSLGSQEQIYLLTGANMTGKSTFIRTVGINLLLAYMGVPVRARYFHVPVLHIFTAIRISDSVQDDISYFKAELNRMQLLMETVKTSDVPYLVLLDEPLRGTNSTDKQMGTQSIIKKLLATGVIGIVATHDTGLCRMEAEHPGKVSNYHFESAVTDTGLQFDFKLKSGGSTSNNATILMKMMGIIDQ